MIRKVFSLLSAVAMFTTTSYAQSQEPCGTVEVNEAYKKDFPEIAKYEKEFRDFMAEGVSNMNIGRSQAKGTFGPNDILHIPVVVHIVHDYDRNNGQEYISDNEVYKMMDSVNIIYRSRNGDTVEVIPPFKKYIGRPNIEFHLATKDPKGRPTTGITRRRSYLSDGGDDQAKFDQWDPSSYLNIWIVRGIGRGGGNVLAYAVFPTSAGSFPYTDGIISGYNYIADDGKTIAHEIGHILGLYHTWGNIAGNAGDCTGDDEVDDTPPTEGHTLNICPLYDTLCIHNEASLSKINLDSTLNPGINNTNNVGFDYKALTNLTLQTVKIYPRQIGQEFEIVNRLGGNVVDRYTTKDSTLGKDALDVPNNDTVTGTSTSTSVSFNAAKYLWLDSVKMYPAPAAAGQPFTVLLINSNNDTIKTYNGVAAASGPQNVPISTFIPSNPGGDYKLVLSQNPGFICDTVVSAADYKASVAGAITIKDIIDVNNNNRYKFFYDWAVRYDALTTSDTSQIVPLNFKVLPNDNNYRLEVSQNPGLGNDSIGPAPYIKSVACVLEVSNETTNNRYNVLYDLNIRYGYIKNCIDYPDTVNTQNIMNYTSCPIMFTHGQVERMRRVLESDVAKRNNWVNDTTHVRTGILTELGGTYGVKRDLKPVPDVSVERSSGVNASETYYLCADGNSQFRFENRSWRDTVTNTTFAFTNGAGQATITNSSTNNDNRFLPFSNTFSQPGWVDVTITASGNNSGDSTRVMENLVYAADPNNAINPLNGFYMEFDKNDANNNVESWPIFNYYDNDLKWEVADNVGFYDNSCIVYKGFDNRQGTELFTGTPRGDYDDFFTPAFDLSGMTATECRLNFMSSGVFRVTDSRLMKDELEISYSIDCGQSWRELTVIEKADLANKGTLGVAYSPLWTGDWKLQSIDIPSTARQSRVFFRFRFKPGVDDVNTNASRILPGTGNNFYIDRINISPFKLGVNTLLTDGKNIALAPNPTNGSTQLIIKSTKVGAAQINVTDVTGKLVYSTTAQITSNITNVEIPASAIGVKGIYMVHVNAGGETFTEKLVSY